MACELNMNEPPPWCERFALLSRVSYAQGLLPSCTRVHTAFIARCFEPTAPALPAESDESRTRPRFEIRTEGYGNRAPRIRR